MTDTIKRLTEEAISQARDEGRAMAVRACSTCRHGGRREYQRCKATGLFISVERNFSHGACAMAGKLWEPMPPRQLGIFEMSWRFLFGGRSKW